MSNERTRMRIGPPGQKIVWKTLAVTSKDPVQFAHDLESALQELTDSGFNIISQMARDGSLVITANQMINERETLAPPPDTQPSASLRRRIVEMPAARSQGNTTDEVLYHYIEHGKQEQKAFPSIVEALRLVKEHLALSAGNGTTLTPICLIAVTQTYFDITSLPTLLRTFAEDLSAEKPLE
jgi:hypothetical protein